MRLGLAFRSVLGCLLLTTLGACEALLEREPEVATGKPDWRSKEQPVQTSRPRPGVSAAGYATSDPASEQVAAAQHRDTLLADDGASLAANEVGYYMDTQEARLIQLLKGTGMEAERLQDSFEFTLVEAFATNSNRLLEPARQRLALIAQVLAEYDRTRISVYGHTDDQGDEGYNQELSVRRAAAVADFLQDLGVDARRLFVVGFGETRPIADNDTVSGRARNRRVELLIEPLVPAQTEIPTESG